MSHPTNLKECLNSFRKGLFQNLSDQYWSLPNGVMDLLEADDAGCCWFLFHVDPLRARSYDEECPAFFRLYEKSRDFYVEATGKAVLVRDPEQWLLCDGISENLTKLLKYHGLVVRLKIQDARIIRKGNATRNESWRRRFLLFVEWLLGKSNGKVFFPSPALTS